MIANISDKVFDVALSVLELNKMKIKSLRL